ncbi:MAG: ABC transporter permease [Chloroflexota bacterium]|nr:ABC transporter permease [Chloroflexota bacterium]MDE3193960.1 ABC transporter permease [Chloroflexota bacterium]
MLTYLLRRLALFIPVLVLISILVFSLLHLAPGDPVNMIVGEDRPGPEVIAAIRKEYGFDDPLPIQYLRWASHAAVGDLGYSYRSREAVTQVVLERLPTTVELSVLSIAFGLVLALPLGILAALRRGTWIDAVSSAVAALGISMPAFWIGILLIYLFALTLRWVPPSGYVSPTEDLAQNLRLMVLPVITLGLGYGATLTRYVRASMLESLGLDFVRTARAKGLSGAQVVFGHVLRSALVPIVTVLGIETGRLLGGAVLTETIFALPGMGRLAVDAILSSDFPTMQGAVLIMALWVLLANLVVDLLYGVLDPRMGRS